MPRRQLGCSHGARPEEQGGRPADPDGTDVVGGPLRGGAGAGSPGTCRPGEARGPRGAADRRGGRRDPSPHPEPGGPRVPRAVAGSTHRGRCVPVQGRRALRRDGRSGARLLPRRPRRGRGAGGPRAPRRGRVPRDGFGGGRCAPRPSLGHRHRSQVSGARARGQRRICPGPRPLPTQRWWSTIACPFRSSWGEPSWCAERWSAARRGSARPETP